jgi:hypothetical protein
MFLLLGMASGNRAQAQSVFEGCIEDIKSYCSQTTLGNGRLIACLYAHEDKVSDTCDAAINDYASQLDYFFEKTRHFTDQCRDDIQKYCDNTKYGSGRVYSCLAEQSEPLSASCQKVLPEIKQRFSE